LRHKPNSGQGTQVETIELDVAEGATRFVFDEAPAAYSNSFITQGYIYEYGKLMGPALRVVLQCQHHWGIQWCQRYT
jgi:hypothetical protein